VETEEGQPPVELDGEGDDTGTTFEHDGGLVITRYAQEEQGDLTVIAVPADDGDEVELVSVGQRTQGARAGALPAGSYRLEVRAVGAWQVVVDRPRYVEGVSLPTTVNSSDEVVTDPFRATGADVRIELEALDGGGDFEVRVVDAVDGEEAGAFTTSGGEETISLDEGLYLLEVLAGGRWTAILS
jgi:predicted phage tail protein